MGCVALAWLLLLFMALGRCILFLFTPDILFLWFQIVDHDDRFILTCCGITVCVLILNLCGLYYNCCCCCCCCIMFVSLKRRWTRRDWSQYLRPSLSFMSIFSFMDDLRCHELSTQRSRPSRSVIKINCI